MSSRPPPHFSRAANRLTGLTSPRSGPPLGTGGRWGQGEGDWLRASPLVLEPSGARLEGGIVGGAEGAGKPVLESVPAPVVQVLPAGGDRGGDAVLEPARNANIQADHFVARTIVIDQQPVGHRATLKLREGVFKVLWSLNSFGACDNVEDTLKVS